MSKKEWTVLVYLNGNNELGREMEKAFLDIKNSVKNEETNIVIQLGKIDSKIGSLIRGENIEYKEKWTGVRRYSFVGEKERLESESKSINMADYRSLYDFIQWGINNFNSKRYMLILSGHGFILSSMTDLAGESPYTMGNYELCNAINKIQQDYKKKIDIFIADMCFMNTLEIIYELGKNKANTISNLLTYVDNGPLEGMNYSYIIDKINSDPTNKILKNIVEKSENKLIAVNINHSKLEKIRYLCLKELQQLIKIDKEESRHINYLDDINIKVNKQIKKIIICSSIGSNESWVVQIICFRFDFTNYYKKNNRFKLLYNKFSFARTILNSKDIIVPKQNIFTKKDIITLIKSYRNDEEYLILKDVSKLYEIKKWIG